MKTITILSITLFTLVSCGDFTSSTTPTTDTCSVKSDSSTAKIDTTKSDTSSRVIFIADTTFKKK